MDIKNFVLTYYKNAAHGFLIQRIEKPTEAKKMHTHEYFQVYYIEKGCLMHYVSESISQLMAGDMFIIPPGIKHRIEEKADTVFYALSFTKESLGEISQMNSIASDFLRRLSGDSDIRPKITLPSEEIIQIENIIEHIYEEFKNKKMGYGDIIKSNIEILLTMFARIYYENTDDIVISSLEDNKHFILHCINYIENNFSQHITLDSMVKLSAMSKSSFCRLFSEVTGCTFNRYLNMCRIKKAVEYIKKGYKITAVYGLCGYNDFSTFYRNFKSIMGVSPKQYESKLTK